MSSPTKLLSFRLSRLLADTVRLSSDVVLKSTSIDFRSRPSPEKSNRKLFGLVSTPATSSFDLISTSMELAERLLS